MSELKLTLSVLPVTLAVCKLGPHEALPHWATRGEFFSVTRTLDELSLVCEQENVPEGVKCERGWRCLKVEAALDFALVGILAALSTVLANAGISIFALSTYNTDYVLVKSENLESAIAALRQAGYDVTVPIH